MKIAVASDDGITVSRHFGRSPYCVVVTVKDGDITHRQTRAKSGHHTYAAARKHPDNLVDELGRHGFSRAAASRHTDMAETIEDCQALICGGMGWGAYESMKNNNIDTVITDIMNIDDAVESYLKETIVNLMDRLH